MSLKECLSLSPRPLLLRQQVSPPSRIVPGTITQVTQSGSEAGSLHSHEENREEAAVLTKDHAPPAICDWLATLP